MYNIDIFKYTRKLAKTDKALNFFSASKDIASLRLFKNRDGLSRLQSIYLAYLYFYTNLKRDISSGKIEDIILKDEVYEDAYCTFVNKNKNKNQPIDNKQHDISLVFSNDDTEEGK